MQKIKSGKDWDYVNPVALSFDIETTNDPNTESAYMYIWQVGVNGQAFYGRTWVEFFEFVQMLRAFFVGKLYVFIHNMGFEMSFLLPRIEQEGLLKRVFAKDPHTPLEIELTNGIIFRDSMSIANMSLSALAKAYCTTQKLTGDLDYTILRNSTTELTEKELAYCENDVKILCEYADILHRTYTYNGEKIPLTSTGIVRRLIKKQLGSKQRWATTKSVKKLFPKTVDDYNFIMSFLFRGAMTHAQTAACDEIIYNVKSRDLKSAYPAEMVHKLYPISEFYTIAPKLALSEMKRGKAVIFIAEFTEIVSKTAHVVESKHKVINAVNAEWENGRLAYAEKLTVFLTDVDYDIYKMVYNWDNMTILKAQSATKGLLPEYITKPLFDVFIQKEEVGKRVKNDPFNRELAQEYLAIKGKLNSFYGCTVARLNLSSYDFVNGEWVEKFDTTYDKEINKQILSPFWGIYVTAYCRYTIISALVGLGDNAIYTDTDSVKFIGNDTYFDTFNDKIEKVNKGMCDYYDLPIDVFRKLGQFEYEYTATRFKTLGAKRYLCEIDGKIHATIAGLPKHILEDYAEKWGNDDTFSEFAPEMSVEISGKHAHKYNGETWATIDGELMHEYGSCYIFQVPFKMTVDAVFLLCAAVRKELKERELNE